MAIKNRDRFIVSKLRETLERGDCVLDFSYERLGDAVVAFLTRTADLSHIKELNLSWNELGDFGVKALAVCSSLRNLKILNLPGILPTRQSWSRFPMKRYATLRRWIRIRNLSIESVRISCARTLKSGLNMLAVLVLIADLRRALRHHRRADHPGKPPGHPHLARIWLCCSGPVHLRAKHKPLARVRSSKGSPPRRPRYRRGNAPRPVRYATGASTGPLTDRSKVYVQCQRINVLVEGSTCPPAAIAGALVLRRKTVVAGQLAG